MGESLDWISVMCPIHNIVPTVYSLWYTHVAGRKAPPSTVAMAVPSDFAAVLCDLGSGSGLVPDFDADGGNGDGVNAERPYVDEKQNPATKTAAENLNIATLQ